MESGANRFQNSDVWHMSVDLLGTQPAEMCWPKAANFVVRNLERTFFNSNNVHEFVNIIFGTRSKGIKSSHHVLSGSGELIIVRDSLQA